MLSNRLLVTIAFGLALPLSAMAQPAATPAPRGEEGGHHRGRMARPDRAETTAEQRAARVERHLSELRGRLRITAAQQPQWDGFATATRDNATEMHARFQARAARLPSMGAAENMVDFAEISQLHAQQLARLATSFTTLYAVLAADQQRDADALFRRSHGPGGMMGRGDSPRR
ncbi:Spy/CpxP family protein refolding chaperone [Rhodovarius sp.]|uniref:Spy/CpxP family protein refolding chaperone n=1 Tax=Rhodovarius sp. TaxID=2972673 RepID=UPI0034A2D185